jgi:transposase
VILFSSSVKLSTVVLGKFSNLSRYKSIPVTTYLCASLYINPLKPRRAKKDDWKEVKRVSIDEVSKRKGHKDFVTVVSSIDAGALLEVIDSHKQDDIIEVLKQQPIEIREKVEEVS